MSVFTNKHVVIALLVSPILAVIAYLMVDKMVAPTPVKAEQGRSYPLVARSNCRYESGQCTLDNGDFKLILTPSKTETDQQTRIKLQSEFPIDGAQFAILNNQGHELYSDQSVNGELQFDTGILDQAQGLRLAVSSAGTLYFVETQLLFLNKESLLPQ